MPDAGSPPASSPQTRSVRAYVFASRLFIAHVLAYPLAFVAAVAAMPVAIHLSFETIEALVAEHGRDVTIVGHYVVRLVAWPAGLAFALPHLSVIPYALDRGGHRARRAHWVVLGAVAALILAAGGISWVWLLTL